MRTRPALRLASAVLAASGGVPHANVRVLTMRNHPALLLAILADCGDVPQVNNRG
ncbi:hypothetical protein GCM10022380_69580 [Amycolatopsis tucumanensis]|uniref:Ankyrin repeat domain-containing protein n=1 Tax=Amycolatopsis tucumanensis TaxID=401106 RepID=A0ABP7JDS1_9PSEU